MAKFRRGHDKTRGSGIRMIVLVIGIGIAYMALKLVKSFSQDPGTPGVEMEAIDSRDYLPAAGSGQIVHHAHYSLSYAEKFEQAEWVAYELTRQELDGPRVERTDWFYADYAIETRSAFYRDYSGSGYTRGHLAPAADMAFDSIAMRESFFMSNISPQLRAFNGGIWRELEELTRDWARESGRLYVVTGPVLTGDPLDRIGTNRVAVPETFYKVLADPDEPEKKSIAFIIPNALSEEPIMSYVVSVDSVERLTGIDFFVNLTTPVDEASFDPALWPVDERRFSRRIKEWNRQ